MAEPEDRSTTGKTGLFGPRRLSPNLTPLTHWANYSKRSWLVDCRTLPKNTACYQIRNLAADRAEITEQALLVLANAVDRAWYKHKLVTLISFDMQGVFNGVNKVSLDARLRAKGIPAVARKWIASFMSDRYASIGFDDFRTEMTPLANAGLAQGSPILIAFFNPNLVDEPVTIHGGASAFIDDYFRWRVGRSAEENQAKIQSEDIPRTEAWAHRTGSRFAAEKTELIHLTRKKGEQLQGQMVMNGKVFQRSPKAKLLGVIFDQKLRWGEHVQQAIKRATCCNSKEA